jgi:16S rRNA (guanine527-N7)-methyltransferase
MEQLRTSAQILEISITDEQLKQFSIYYDELIAWNAHTNITAITNKEDVITKHFLDSLTIIPHLFVSTPLSHEVSPSVSPSSTKLLDIGTGAGFPGIPLKIMKPELEVTLLETVGKKVEFLNHIIQKLDLKNITAVHGRAEDLAHEPQYREKFNIVTGRAVAHLSILAEYSLPFLTIGGMLICQKNRSDEELADAGNAITELGGTMKTQIPVAIFGLENRSIIIIEKVQQTPQKYPRKAGIPSKRPL